MDILTRTNLQEARSELTVQAGKATNLSWKGAFFLGAALYIGIGVLLPYFLDVLGEIRLDPKGNPFEQAGAGVIRMLPMAELPLILTGSIAGLMCWGLALWKLGKEILRK